MAPVSVTHPVPSSVPSVWANTPLATSSGSGEAAILRRGECSHRPVVDDAHYAGGPHPGFQPYVQIGELGEIGFIVDGRVIPDTPCLVNLTPDNLVLHHDIGETEPDSIEAGSLVEPLRIEAGQNLRYRGIARRLVHGACDPAEQFFSPIVLHGRTVKPQPGLE